MTVWRMKFEDSDGNPYYRYTERLKDMYEEIQPLAAKGYRPSGDPRAFVVRVSAAGICGALNYLANGTPPC